MQVSAPSCRILPTVAAERGEDRCELRSLGAGCILGKVFCYLSSLVVSVSLRCVASQLVLAVLDIPFVTLGEGMSTPFGDDFVTPLH